jgi:hypothetical protein
MTRVRDEPESHFLKKKSETMNKRNNQRIAKLTGRQRARAALRKKRKSRTSRAKAELLAGLEARVDRGIARGRAANLELGRTWLQIRPIVGHGQWARYYAARFGSCGIGLRTAQTYMEMAHKADAIAKTANSALFPMARDYEARSIRDATEQARAEVGASSDRDI